MTKNKQYISNKFPKEALDVLPHMRPSIRISPFSSEEWKKILSVPSEEKNDITRTPDFWLDNATDMHFYDSGRTAILACLKHLNLTEDDEVLIVKTTEGEYISSCVTKTIEKVCRWSQKPSDKTRLVLVIHEFGFPCPYEKVESFRKNNIPILEDCAYALGSRIESAPVGTYGDFAIYSLPKYYPVPFGGLLVSKDTINSEGAELKISLKDEDLLRLTISNAQAQHKEWNRSRRENWNFFSQAVKDYSLTPYLELSKDIIPGAFLMKVFEGFAGEDVKKRLNSAGVESTQYYTQGGFYFPIHPLLTDYDKEYILYHFLNHS